MKALTIALDVSSVVYRKYALSYGVVAQLAERHTCTVKEEGSNPFDSTNLKFFDIMKLKQFLEAIQHHTKDIPNRDDLEVVFSVDDEGNEYKKAFYEPTLCKIESAISDSNYITAIEMLEDGEIEKEDINAICVL